jgi:hypothetical protein
MQEIYLVQRGNLRKGSSSDKKGVDALVSWAYMGSSEFEWGALPESLRSFRAAADKYVRKATGLKAHDGRALMLLCKPEDYDTVVEFLVGNSVKRDHQKWRLKEHLGLAESLAKPVGHHGQFDVWWDVDNHWMAVLGEKPAEQVFDVVLAGKPQ